MDCPAVGHGGAPGKIMRVFQGRLDSRRKGPFVIIRQVSTSKTLKLDRQSITKKTLPNSILFAGQKRRGLIGRYLKELLINNLATLADCEGNETIYERNDMGQVVQITYPDGMEETFAYNADHLLATHAIPGQVIKYGYNAYGYVTLATITEVAASRDGPQSVATL